MAPTVIAEAVELPRLLALLGLVVAAAAYYLRIRRREEHRLESWERAREDSNRRATARLRRIQRRDKV